MQGIKATTESSEPKDLNNSSTARSEQRNNQFVATGILSTWELPTLLQYTIPDANKQLHLLLLTHEMWELPTPLIEANRPSREIEVWELPAQPPRYTGTTRSSLNIASWGPKDLNNSSTARSEQRNNQFVATGILSTWELPTHLQYTIPDANKQLHLLLLTHEMWELPTPLIAANRPSREIEVRELPAQPPRYTGTTRSSLNIASCTEHTHSQAYNPCSILNCKKAHIRTSSLLSYNYNKQLATMTQIHHPKKLGAKSDAYANRLHKGDVFAHLTSFKQTFENNIQTKRLIMRSPTLPLSPSSELSTTNNRRI
ncbi:transcriptional activator DEMETER [Dorcoceras hygrometricum]|uniref:Transcriptional activator DEMETER n=1 Tax=Dorcoceras hygrometricum TaxID=472368 RepID=A0A2Z7DE25_9LAMI|nr:transcriptional activator DEMETER [Dorcoceras hygrometricum]